MKRLNKIKVQFGQWLKFLFSAIRYHLGNCILIDAWVWPSLGGIKKHNFGDDINVPLLEALTGKHVSLLKKVKSKDDYLLAIGSIVDSLTTEKAIIWGSGYLAHDKPLLHLPKKVCAVRGPLTQKKLEEYGVKCPCVYGDPALLLPLIFTPSVKKTYKFGIIPHFHDYDLPHVKKFREDHPEVLFIKMENYTSWKDVIAQICSCENIVSSSLHGLIVSDAYGVPNVYVKFSELVEGGEFKFKDYMGGVKRNYFPPIDFSLNVDLEKVIQEVQNYIRIDYDYRPLLRAFPYNLSKNFRNMI